MAVLAGPTGCWLPTISVSNRFLRWARSRYSPMKRYGQIPNWRIMAKEAVTDDAPGTVFLRSAMALASRSEFDRLVPNQGTPVFAGFCTCLLILYIFQFSPFAQRLAGLSPCSGLYPFASVPRRGQEKGNVTEVVDSRSLISPTLWHLITVVQTIFKCVQGHLRWPRPTLRRWRGIRLRPNRSPR